jgi:hypothetical protein
MKRMIISEEEKNRILGMHQDATKRHYLGEQSISSTNTNPQSMNKREELYNQYIEDINRNMPFDVKQLQGMVATLKSGTKEGGNVMDLDVVQKFFKNEGQDFIKKINPKGYDEATNSQFTNYTSLMSNQSCNSCRTNSVYQMMLDDVIKLKTALILKAQQKSGYTVTLPTWAQSANAKAAIDIYAKNLGIS